MKITMITHIVLSKKYETLIELSDRLERKKTLFLKQMVKNRSFRAYKAEKRFRDMMILIEAQKVIKKYLDKNEVVHLELKITHTRDRKLQRE